MDPPTSAGEQDPGWRPALRGAAIFLVPGMATARSHRQRAEGGDGLVLLRSVLISFCLGLLLFGVILLFLEFEPTDSPPASVAAAVVAAVGVAALVAGQVVPKPLDCSSDRSLAGSYRVRFFLRAAFAESAALVGFMMTFLAGNRALYFLGAAFAAVGFARLAPTARSLERDQQDLIATGYGRSLIGALRAGPA